MKKLILVFAVTAITAGAYAQTNSTSKSTNPHNKSENKNHKMHNHTDGVTMQDGKMVKVEDGKSTPLKKDRTMSNGTKISRDGTYTDKDGKKMKMKEGQHMDVSGRMTDNNPKRDKDSNHIPDNTKNIRK